MINMGHNAMLGMQKSASSMGRDVRTRWHPARVAALLVLVSLQFVVQQPAVAKMDEDKFVESAVQQSVSAELCAEEAFLEASDLNFETCYAESVRVAQLCWERMRVLVPDLRFGTEEFLAEKNQRVVLGIVFALEKCIQASILFPDSLTEGEQQSSTTKLHPDRRTQSDNDDGELDENSVWEGIIESAKAEGLIRNAALNLVLESISVSDLFSVTLAQGGMVWAFKVDDGEKVVRVSEGLERWREVLLAANLQSATRAEGAVVLTSKLMASTESHDLSVSFLTHRNSSYRNCKPELRYVACGSCNISESDDYRVVLTWHAKESNYASSGGLDAELESAGRLQVATKCWKDGMAEMGLGPGFL